MQNFIMFICILAFTFSCGSQDDIAPHNTELDWGHLTYADSTPILNMQPGDTLGVCGPKQVEVINAIRQWASHTNRRNGFNIVGGCNQATNIYTEVWTRQQMCRYARKGPRCGIMGLAIRNRLIVVSGGTYTNLILHETGHLFGMCDQYTTRGQWNSTCSAYWRTGRMFTGSAMGAVAAGRTQLTWDDVRGIQALTKRTDLRANVPWLHL